MIDRAGAFGEEQQGVSRYLGALREHWLLVLAIVVVAVGAAAAYSKTATKRYQAQADVLVTPVATSDNTFVGIPLLRESSDQSRAVLTAARLVESPQIADAVKRRLGTSDSRTALLNSISVTPLGQSNIVTVAAKASNPDRAARIANAFAEQLIAQRTSQFQAELRAIIRRLTDQLNALPPAARGSSATGIALATRLGALRGLVGAADPTLSISSPAVPPDRPSWPRPVLSIAVALVASLLLGSGLAIALGLISPKVNREDELLLQQRLPILARVPRMPRRLVRGYLTGREPLPGDVRESYRTLRASLASSGRDHKFPGAVLVTSAIPGEGKTMTSVNLAVTLALADQRVILVDGDLRRPMVATVFGTASRSGFANVLTGEATVEEALLPAPGYGDRLQLMLASPEHAHMVDLMEPGRVERVLAELRFLCDVVIVDSPPLTEVSDALSLADEVDAVVVATRLGRTRRDKLNELRRALAQRGVSPAGFVVTLRRRSRGQGYSYGSSEPHQMPSPAAYKMAATESSEPSPSESARAREGAVAGEPEDF